MLRITRMHGCEYHIETRIVLLTRFSFEFPEEMQIDEHKLESFSVVNVVKPVDEAPTTPKSIKGDLRAPSKLLNRVCTPMFDSVKSVGLSSFVSVHVTTNGVTWTRFAINQTDAELPKTESAQVTDWGCHRIETYKMHLIDTIKLYMEIAEKIPPADVYVMEERYYGRATLSQVQHAEAVALLAVQLINRANSSMKDRLYFLANTISGR